MPQIQFFVLTLSLFKLPKVKGDLILCLLHHTQHSLIAVHAVVKQCISMTSDIDLNSRYVVLLLPSGNSDSLAELKPPVMPSELEAKG